MKCQEKWVMDSAASICVCKDQGAFDTLQINGDFGHVNVGDGLKLKVEGVGSVRMKLHDDTIRILKIVRYVPKACSNIISLGVLTMQGNRYVGSGKWCKVYRGSNLVLQGVKMKNNICYVDGYSMKRSEVRKTDIKKKVRLSLNMK